MSLIKHNMKNENYFKLCSYGYFVIEETRLFNDKQILTRNKFQY